MPDDERTVRARKRAKSLADRRWPDNGGLTNRGIQRIAFQQGYMAALADIRAKEGASS